MAVMFDPNIPGGFPSGYGGASGAETGAGGGAWSGAAGAAAGAGIVLGAAMGLGPWQGFSDTLDKWGGGTEPSTTNIAGSAINELARQLGLDFDFTGKGQTAQKNRLLATKTSRLSGFPLGLSRDAMVRFLPGLEAEISRRIAIENARAAPGLRLESLEGLRGRQLTGAIRRNKEQKRELVKNKERIELARTTGNKKYLGGKGTGQPKVISQEDLKKQITQEVFDNFLSNGVNVYAETPDATFTGEDPRLTDEGQYTPPDPTVQDPEPTPVETPTGPDFEPQVPQVPQWTDEPLIPPGEEQPVLQGPEEPPEVPPEEESPSLPPGLSSLLNLIKPKLEESGLGLSDILPSLGLEFPSLSLGGFVNRSAGGFGLTPVPPPPRTEFPTGVQPGGGIPLGKFEYKDDYVGYPLL